MGVGGFSTFLILASGKDSATPLRSFLFFFPSSLLPSSLLRVANVSASSSDDKVGLESAPPRSLVLAFAATTFFRLSFPWRIPPPPARREGAGREGGEPAEEREVRVEEDWCGREEEPLEEVEEAESCGVGEGGGREGVGREGGRTGTGVEVEAGVTGLGTTGLVSEEVDRTRVVGRAPLPILKLLVGGLIGATAGRGAGGGFAGTAERREGRRWKGGAGEELREVEPFARGTREWEEERELGAGSRRTALGSRGRG